MMNLIVLSFCILFVCVLTWKYTALDGQWINVCHTLGVSSRTHPRDVLDKLRIVVAQSEIFDQFIED